MPSIWEQIVGKGYGISANAQIAMCCAQCQRLSSPETYSASYERTHVLSDTCRLMTMASILSSSKMYLRGVSIQAPPSRVWWWWMPTQRQRNIFNGDNKLEKTCFQASQETFYSKSGNHDENRRIILYSVDEALNGINLFIYPTPNSAVPRVITLSVAPSATT